MLVHLRQVHPLKAAPKLSPQCRIRRDARCGISCSVAMLVHLRQVHPLKAAPKLSPQCRIRRDARCGEQFGEGECEPDAAVAEHLRQ